MRYYSLTISDPKSGAIWFPTSDGRLIKGVAPPTVENGVSVVTVGKQSTYTFTSHPNGKLKPPDPGALNIDFDIPVFPQHTFQGGLTLRLSGVGLRMIGQSANLNGQNFTFSAGMGKGLPLAKPDQAGEIIRGRIYQAFGNWHGTEQTIDLICLNSDIAPIGGILFDWQPGQTFSSALSATFSQAFPNYNPDIGELSTFLQTPPSNFPQQHTAEDLSGFSKYIQELTQFSVRKSGGDKNYDGVWIVLDANKIRASDGVQAPQTLAIAFEDLIGQPTWIGPATITFKTVMRADLQVADFVTLPTNIAAPYAATTTPAAVPNSPASSKIAFSGKFTIAEVHHYGSFRQSDAESWNTTFTANFVG